MTLTKTLIAGLGTALLLTSCLGDDNRPVETLDPTAIVTVKTTPDTKTVYFQLDKETTLLPVNLKEHPFEGKEVRALLNFKEDSSAPHEGFTKAVHVNWINGILTKDMVPSVEDNDTEYGKAPVGLRKENCLIEDGYLTLVFTAVYGDPTITHTINLVTGADPEDPYALELRHDAKGDLYGQTVGESWVAFRLDGLPDTQGEKKTLKIRFHTISGTETIELEYVTGKKTETDAALPTTRSASEVTFE